MQKMVKKQVTKPRFNGKMKKISLVCYLRNRLAELFSYKEISAGFLCEC